MKRSMPNRQRGMTLLVGLVMLVLLMLMAVSAFNLSRTNTAVTGNMQNKMEAINAAMQATEQTISSTQFIDTPNNAVPGSCGVNRVCVDVNGDGNSDVVVTLDPPCIKKIQVIKNANLDMTNPDDAACALGVSQSLGVAGSATGNSLCANSVWEITANASDSVTQARSTVVTGVAVRVAADNALDTSKACP
jgi:Tfp pilus assembly protein PilX